MPILLVPPLIAAAKFVGARLLTSGAVSALKFAISPPGRNLIKHAGGAALGVQLSTSRSKAGRLIENGWNLGEKAYSKADQLGLIPEFGSGGGKSGSSGRQGRGNNQGTKTPQGKKAPTPQARPNRRTG